MEFLCLYPELGEINEEFRTEVDICLEISIFNFGLHILGVNYECNLFDWRRQLYHMFEQLILTLSKKCV